MCPYPHLPHPPELPPGVRQPVPPRHGGQVLEGPDLIVEGNEAVTLIEQPGRRGAGGHREWQRRQDLSLGIPYLQPCKHKGETGCAVLKKSPYSLVHQRRVPLVLHELPDELLLEGAVVDV